MGLFDDFRGILSDHMPTLLPDDPNQNAAARQGLLAFGAAMLGGHGNFGNSLGDSLAAAQKGYNGSLEQQQKAALEAAQKRRLDLDNQETQAKLDEPAQIASIFAGSAPSATQTVGMPLATQTPSSGSLLQGFRSPAPVPSWTPGSDAGQDAPGGILPRSALPQLGAASQTPAATVAAPATSADLYQKYMDYGDRLTQAGRVGAAKPYYDMATKMRPEIQEVKVALDANNNPVNVIRFKDGSEKVSAYGALPDNQVVDLGGRQVLVDKNTGKLGSSFNKTQSPDNIATNATTRRGQDMAHQEGDPQTPITDAAILNAAARYNLDGTLPPMGMGKNAAAGRSAILNKAAELAAGTDPTQQRKDQLAAKGSAAAQNTAVREFSTGKLGNSVRSFNVLQSHLDTMGSMADALGNGNTQMFNKLANSIGAQTGQAAPTNFEAVKHIVGDEIVKAVTGSAGALGDREAAAKTIASANSPAQLRGVIDTYKELARGQVTGLRQQYEVSTGRKDFDKFLSSSSKEAVAPLASLPKKAPVSSAHPADISNLLNKYGSH